MLNKTGKNAAWLVAGRLMNKLLVFAVGVVVARYLGPEDYGLLNYTGAYLTFFAALGALGLENVVLKALAHRENEGEILGTALVLRLVAGALGAGAVIGLVALTEEDQPLTVAVAAMGSVSLLPRGFECLKQWFLSRLESKFAAVAAVAGYLAASLYKIVLVLTGQKLIWFALAVAVEFGVQAAVLWRAYRGPKLTFSRKRAGALLREGSGFLMSGMMVAVYAATDKVMLGRLMDNGAVADYALAASLCAAWGFVLEAVIQSATPGILEAYGKDRQEYLRKNRRLYALVFYVCMAVSAAVCLLAEPVMGLLYGPAYAGAVGPLQVIVWYTAFSYLGGARNGWVACEGKQGQLTLLSALAAGANVGLNLLLIPAWGPVGAAWASLVTQILTALVLPLCIPALRENGKLMLQGIFLRDVL